MSYTIQIEVPPIDNLKAKLQVAYDGGAAGFFTLTSIEDGRLIRILFERELSDDADLIETRVLSGALPSRAAREQLADELEEHNSEELAEVIETLRSPHALVSDLNYTVVPIPNQYKDVMRDALAEFIQRRHCDTDPATPLSQTEAGVSRYVKERYKDHDPGFQVNKQASVLGRVLIARELLVKLHKEEISVT